MPNLPQTDEEAAAELAQLATDIAAHDRAYHAEDAAAHHRCRV